MADEKKIKFAGDASDLSSAFQKIREDAKSLNQGLIEDAMKYSKTSKEQLGFINEQIKALERRNAITTKETNADINNTYAAKFKTATSDVQRDKINTQYGSAVANATKDQKNDDLQIKLLKDLIETIKNTAKEEIAADKKSAEDSAFIIMNDKTGKYSPEEKIKAGLIQDLLGPGKQKLHFNENEEEIKQKKTASFFAALTGDRLVKSVDKSLGLVVHAKSSEDIVKPAAGMVGMGIGALGGAALDLLPLIEGAKIVGADFGKMLGDRFGDAYNRHIEESNNQQMSRNRLSAITQQGGGIGSDFGLNQGQLMDMQNQIFRASYNQKNLAARTRLTLGLERGYGVDQGTMLEHYKSEHMTGQSGADNITSVVAALESKGLMSKDNRLPLGSFLQNQTQMINTFSQSIERVNQNNAADILLKFNKLGGGYDFTDQRSLARVQNIHGQLTNPNNDFTQAANFGVLRKVLGPNASFLDIMKAQEQGLGGEHGAEFMKGTIDMVKQRGGSKENQILSLRSRFPGMTIEQAEKMINGGSEAFAGEDFKELTGQQKINKQGEIIGEGTSRVTSIEKDTAVIADAFAKGAMEGIETVAELFINKMESIMKQYIKKEVDNLLNKIKGNETYGTFGGGDWTKSRGNSGTY